MNNILDEQDTTVTLESDGTGAGRIELEDGGNLLDETFDGAKRNCNTIMVLI